MTFSQMQKEVARNIGTLSSDDTTIIQGVVTTTGIKTRINSLYQDDSLESLMRKYPQDFQQKTYPQSMYRQSFVVDASTSGTTLVSTTSVFANFDEGYKIEAADLTSNTITTFVSATTLTMSGTIPANWIGQTCYILNNEFSFAGQVTDLKEIISIQTRYRTTDDWQFAELRRETDIAPLTSNAFNTNAPIYYETKIKEGSVNYRGVGILPFPTTHTGQFIMAYTERVPALSNDADVPILENIGISDGLIYGVTAWAKRIMGKFEEASQFEMLYRAFKEQMMRDYRPRNRSQPSKLRSSSYFSAIASKRI